MTRLKIFLTLLGFEPGKLEWQPDALTQSGDMDDKKERHQPDRSFRDVDMEKDGEDLLDRAQNKWRSTERGGRKRSFLDIIRTRQIGHIMWGDSLLQREIMEGKRKTQTEANGPDDGGRIRETQRKGILTGGVESMDIWTCPEGR